MMSAVATVHDLQLVVGIKFVGVLVPVLGVVVCFFFFFQAEDGIRDVAVTGVQTCALPISPESVSLVVALHDDAGHVGYGESPPFELPFYSEETLAGARDLITRVLLPRVADRKSVV